MATSKNSFFAGMSRRFCNKLSDENSGILCVLRDFHNAKLKKRFAQDTKGRFYTDIQLKTVMRGIEVFYMKINMRRDSVIFYFENYRIDNADRRCLSI